MQVGNGAGYEVRRTKKWVENYLNWKHSIQAILTAKIKAFNQLTFDHDMNIETKFYLERLQHLWNNDTQ